jgi:hypothetical protein
MDSRDMKLKHCSFYSQQRITNAEKDTLSQEILIIMSSKARANK